MSARRARDTIQAYIDLWENTASRISITTSVSEDNIPTTPNSAPPTPPRKDSIFQKSHDKPPPVHNDAKFISRRVSAQRALEGERGAVNDDRLMALINLVDSCPVEELSVVAPPEFQKIKAAFEGWNPRPMSDDSCIPVSRFSAESSIYSMHAEYSPSKSALVDGNPFDEPTFRERNDSLISQISMRNSLRGRQLSVERHSPLAWDFSPNPFPHPSARVTAMQPPGSMRFSQSIFNHAKRKPPPVPLNLPIEESSSWDIHHSAPYSKSSVKRSAMQATFELEISMEATATELSTPNLTPGASSSSSIASESEQDEFEPLASSYRPLSPRTYSPEEKTTLLKSPIPSSLVEDIPRFCNISNISVVTGSPIVNKAARMLGIGAEPPRVDSPTSFSLGHYSSVHIPSPRTLIPNSPETFASCRSSVEPSSISVKPPPVYSHPPYDATLDSARLFKALKNSKKPDTDLLNETVISLIQDPHKLLHLKQKYKELYTEELLSDIKSMTSGNYQKALMRLLAGPHEAEAQGFHKTESSFHVDDKLIAEALFGKSPNEMKLMKLHFENMYGYPLEKAVENLYLPNLISAGGVVEAKRPAGAFARACLRLINADREVETEESLSKMDTQFMKQREQLLVRNVDDLYKTKHLNYDLLLGLITRKSDIYLSELCQHFHERYKKELAELVVPKDRSKLVGAAHYSYNLCFAMAYALNGAVDKYQRDAKLLDTCMKGIGTNDSRLIARIARIHYSSDPTHLNKVKEEYHIRYGKNLIDRVRTHTKGAYRDLLVKILTPGHHGNEGQPWTTKTYI